MPKKAIDPATWTFLLYFGIIILLYILSPVIVSALMLGLYLSMIIMVPARLLAKIKFIHRKAAVIISSVLIFALLAITVVQIFPIVFDEGKKLFNAITAEGFNLTLPVFFENMKYSDTIHQLVDMLGTRIFNAFSSAGISLLNNLIKVIPDALTASIVFIIAASYLTVLIPVIKKNLWRFFPASTRDKSIGFVEDYYTSLKSFINGQMLIAACVGLIVGVGMKIAGIPYSLFLGFLSFVTNFIPYLGIITAAVPSIFLGLSHYGGWGLLRVAIVLLLGNQIEVWLLSPRIQGDRMELNWFVILLGILLFGGIFGIAGVLFAVPIMVFIRNYWIEYVEEFYKIR